MKKISAANSNLFIVIPAYNESTVMYGVVKKIRMRGYTHIIVVDDGSDDATRERAVRAGATVVRHSINRGKGAAVKTGIEAAKQLGAEMVVTMDGDGQHDPIDISDTVKFLGKGNDVVIGSRFLSRQYIPFGKKIANAIANHISLILYRVRTSDSQSGFRGYGKKALDVVNTFSDRYEFDMEMFREIRRHKLKTIEIPIHVSYTPYSQNKRNRHDYLSAIITVIKLFLPF